jgi:hypothetical protein
VITERTPWQEFAGYAFGDSAGRKILARLVLFTRNVLETATEENYNPRSLKEVEPMRKLFITFWQDDSGAVSPEWMLMATVLVLGSVAALAAMKIALYGNVETLAKAVAGM